MANLNIPSSESTVRLRAIDGKNSMSLYIQRFIEPSLAGFDTLNLTNVCYLIDHPGMNKRILFDCGARKDVENYAPLIKARLNAILKGMKIEADVDEILVGVGVDLQSIDSIVWSHWHWDHIGAAQNFPASVEIVVGPGFRENYMPGYPTKNDAPMLDADFEGRNVREISFSTAPMQIGQFAAFDYFGDGSFYLLDSPGHAIGHMCGLVRTTPTTFVLLGGDICHFPGMFRPSTHTPLPDTIPQQYLDKAFPSPCPCSVFTDHHPLVDPNSEAAKSSTFFEVTSAQPSSYYDREQAMNSIRAMQDFDASPDVLVCIAHDPALTKVLPFINDAPDRDMNDWKAKGYEEKLQWDWLNELPRDGKPGRPMLIDGFWWKGQKINDFEQLQPSR